MHPDEVVSHARKKALHRLDLLSPPRCCKLAPPEDFPALPSRGAAPKEVLDCLREDADNILHGTWQFFGQQTLRVDDPPKWHKDYFAGAEVPSFKPGFRLNHRALPAGADIKFIWELSRWYELVRLAQAAWLLRQEQYQARCLKWLEDWLEHNPPFRGWNWTSPLESGMRLIQFTWIDALLTPDGGQAAQLLESVRSRFLPAHVRYTWRFRSFGSSANNHLLGELAGLIVASARWPACQRWSTDLQSLVRLWEKEVLAQFAADGGNREQALNYQLYSWELCHHSRLALEASGIIVSPEVQERLARAAEFFIEVQSDSEPWDYGDSDNAFVLPVMNVRPNAVPEWRHWFMEPSTSPALNFWMQDRGSPRKAPSPGWQHFKPSGYITFRSPDWFLRWDLSPLGYLRTAAHGHLDALHLSVWFRGRAVVIDPGTGAYFGDLELRTYLASREAHNGACPRDDLFPKRKGPFLWATPHGLPTATREADGFHAELKVLPGEITRTIRHLPDGNGWEVADCVRNLEGAGMPFSVFWQFAPGLRLQQLGEREFQIWITDHVSLRLEIDSGWSIVEAVLATPSRSTLAGTVSPFFRRKTFAPFIKLTTAGDKPCVLFTRFLASISG